MAQGLGPEFKPQYYRKKEGRKEGRKERRRKRKRKDTTGNIQIHGDQKRNTLLNDQWVFKK
jgi:hypothetical protein